MDDALQDLLAMTAGWGEASRRRLAEWFVLRLAVGMPPAAALLTALDDLLREASRS